MSEYLIQDATLTGIADAIRAKAGTTETLKPGDMAAAIAAIEAGGSSAPVSGKAVNFMDYDGTILHSYTLEEAQSLTELPPLPEHDGLICRGWNYTLEKVKALTRPTNIGAMYITDDGKTRLYIRIAAKGRMEVPIYFGQSVDGGVTIDWGDGSPTETKAGTSASEIKHTYADIGDYVITLAPADGCTLEMVGSSSYCIMGSTNNDYKVFCNMLQKCEIGRSVTRIGDSTFSSCNRLASITIPDGVTSIGNSTFQYCNSLASITIPDGVTRIGDSTFSSCNRLASITIPDSVTRISNSAFSSCNSLASITIPDSVTSIGNSTFSSCYSLASITIPDGVTSIGNSTFSSCYSLASITIPDSVTSIGDSMFRNCDSLASITIPDSVTSIGNSTFSSCYSLAEVEFSGTPTTIASNAFSSSTMITTIRVPWSEGAVANAPWGATNATIIYNWTGEESA